MDLSNLTLSESSQSRPIDQYITVLPIKRKKSNKITISNDRTHIKIGKAYIPIWKHIHNGVPRNVPLLFEILCGKKLPRDAYVLDIAHFYKDFVKTMQVSPSQLLKSVKLFQYSIMCCSLPSKYLHACCSYLDNHRILHEDYVCNYVQSDQLRMVCQSDNQLNILPLCIHHLLSPIELKQRVSSSTWKKLCHNTLTRNSNLRMIPIDKLDQCIDYPTALLRNHSDLVTKTFYNLEFDSIIKLLQKNRLVTSKRMSSTVDTILDTMMMATRLTLNYNMNWSLKRWYKQHHLFTKKCMSLDYPTEPFNHYQLKYLQLLIRQDNFVAKLLTSQCDIAIEGGEMHHCVASYAKQSSLGYYAVYSVVNTKTQCRSTLGFPLFTLNNDRQFNAIDSWSRKQHVTYSNDPVDVNTERFGNFVIQTYVDNKLSDQ